MKNIIIAALLSCALAVNAQAIQLIPAGTQVDAEKKVPIYLVDATDGYTEETGITITIGSGTECQVSKNGAAYAACEDSTDGAWAEVGNGLYTLLLDDADVDTPGYLAIRILDSGGAHRVFMGLVQIVSVADGTAQAGAAGTITLDSGDAAGSDFYNDGMAVEIIRGTGAGQVRCITDYDGGTKVATVDPNWTTNPDTDSEYRLIPSPECDVGADVDAILADTGTDGVVLANDAITAAKIAANAIGASEIATDAIGVDEIAANAITSSEIAASAIGASEIATAAIGDDEFDATVSSTLDDFFDTDSGTDYGSSVSGSVVKEIADNAAGSGSGAGATY